MSHQLIKCQLMIHLLCFVFQFRSVPFYQLCDQFADRSPTPSILRPTKRNRAQKFPGVLRDVDGSSDAFAVLWFLGQCTTHGLALRICGNRRGIFRHIVTDDTMSHQ
jgi:hypothetical protein